jgi:hypothetical protein
VAADGSIGGFSGQWGEGCKINKKRALLQAEGVQFDDRTGKIVKDCLLTSIPSAAENGSSDARPAKKQKTERSVDDEKRSKYFAVKTTGEESDAHEGSSDAPTTCNVDAELREVTLQMIEERAVGKTC